MDNKGGMQTTKCYLNHFLNVVRQTPIIFFFLFSTQLYPQQETKLRSFGIQAGINSGILGGGIGPSFSFHYALRTEKVLQLESMLFFDSHSGETFLTGGTQKNSGFGLAAGTRVNVKPQKNWNPSFLIMPGIIYGSEKQSTYPDGRSGISGMLCLALSNTFYRKHMVTIGLNQGDYIPSMYLKYGFWF